MTRRRTFVRSFGKCCRWKRKSSTGCIPASRSSRWSVAKPAGRARSDCGSSGWRAEPPGQTPNAWPSHFLPRQPHQRSIRSPPRERRDRAQNENAIIPALSGRATSGESRTKNRRQKTRTRGIVAHSALRRSHCGFENLGCGRNHLERPGCWQNRGGFALRAHVLTGGAETLPHPSVAIRENQPACEKLLTFNTQVRMFDFLALLKGPR